MTIAPFRIEKATANDLEAIRQLLRPVHFDTRKLYPAHFLLARTDDARVVGCAQIKPARQQRILSSVVIDPQFQRRGIGRALIESLLEREQDAVFLMCFQTLVPYYRQFGFRPISGDPAPRELHLRAMILSILARFTTWFQPTVIMVRPSQREE